MKNLYLIILAFSFSAGLFAQSSFHKSFSLPGKSGFLYRSGITSDGGFVSVGRVSDFSTFDDDFLIMKTDASGNPSWIKKNSTPDFEEFTDLAEVANGDIVAVGSSTNMNTFLSTAVVEKFNSAGVPQWCKSYSVDAHSTNAKKIAKDSDGNLYVLGTVAVDGSADDYFIMKLDAGGNILSQTTFGTPDSDYPLGFIRKSNGDFFICGWDNTFTGENIHLLKINSDMTVAWNKLITGPIRYFAYDIRERSDGNLVLAGRFDDTSTSFDILICTLDDSSGEQVWAKSYSAADGGGTYAYGLTIAAGDVITVTGPSSTTEQGTFLLSTDASGSINWSNKYGQPGSSSMGYGVTTASDGSYLVCGPLSNSSDAIVQLLKTNSSGALACNSSGYELLVTSITLPMQTREVAVGTASLLAQNHTLTETSYNTLETICLGTGFADKSSVNVAISPNPSQGKFTVTVPGSYAGLKIALYNSDGMELMSTSLPSGTENQVVSKTFETDVPEGIYFVKIGGGLNQITRKLVIIR